MKYGLLVIALILMFSTVSSGQDSFVNNNLMHTPKPYGVETEWRTCSLSSDCIAALRGCWTWEPINKKYLPEFIERNPPICKKATDPGLQPVTACEETFCKATDQKTGVVWSDWLKANFAN